MEGLDVFAPRWPDMTDAQLRAELDSLRAQELGLSATIEEIRRQIDHTVSWQANNPGWTHPDPRWLGRARAAVSFKSQHRRRLNATINEINHELKCRRIRRLEARDGERESVFIQLCRDRLPRETFLALWEEVDRLAKKAAESEPVKEDPRPCP